MLILLVLACAVFAQATSEFMLSGLVPEIAADLDVPPAAAGSLTSAFAVGMVVGAPVMALLARRFPPRRTLAGFLVLFVVAHVAGALTPEFGVLLVTRLLAALANAGFLAVALSVAARSVPPERTARATATLLAGTTLALIVGVPAGAALGQEFGWRSTFWAVALIATPALIGVLAGVPARAGERGAAGIGGELAALRRRPVVLTLLAAALVNGGTFAAYTYLALLLTTSGVPVPAGLAVFGIGAFAGVTVAARVADAHFRALAATGAVVLPLGWVGLALAAGDGPVVLAAAGIMGAAGFAVGSALIARSLGLAPDAPTLGGGVTTAALNVGATAGPLLGGAGLAVAGVSGPVWTAALLVVAAVPVGALALS